MLYLSSFESFIELLPVFFTTTYYYTVYCLYCGVQFPWIVSDLFSPFLDLGCRVLRNLNLPIGAQNEHNAEGIREKFDLFEDTSATAGDGGFALLCLCNKKFVLDDNYLIIALAKYL